MYTENDLIEYWNIFTYQQVMCKGRTLSHETNFICLIDSLTHEKKKKMIKKMKNESKNLSQ